jgi:hypothetical protein
MKFLRIGNPGNEIPALLDKDGKIRDLSKYVSDFDRKNLNFENLEKLQQLDFSKLDELDNNQRIGSCVSDPGNFFEFLGITILSFGPTIECTDLLNTTG